jgi:hypothetical protein
LPCPYTDPTKPTTNQRLSTLVPRFRRLLYRPRRGLGWPLWVDDPAFDLANHVRVHPLAAPGDEAQPLQAWLLAGLPDYQVGLFLRAHHTIADGVAGMAAFGALLDLDADTPVSAVPTWTPAPIPTAGELLGDNLGRRLEVSHAGCSSRWQLGLVASSRRFSALVQEVRP